MTTDENESGVDKASVDKTVVDRSDVNKAKVDKAGVDESDVNMARVDKAGVDESDVNKVRADASSVSVGRADVFEVVWLFLSSPRTTAALALAMAAVAMMTAFIPQGNEALEIARSERAGTLHALIAWGLTDVFESKWFAVLAVLLATNILAAFARLTMLGLPGNSPVKVPADAPHQVEFEARAPERAAEILRSGLRAFLRMPPVTERFDGARVTLVFDTSRRARFGPIFAHLGLVLLVTGAAGVGSHDPRDTIPFARFEIKELTTQSVGLFDMEANEPFQIFQSRAQYVLRDYVRDKEGLGPAVRIEKIEPNQQAPGAFWVYLLAPVEVDRAGRRVFFDERHRSDRVGFHALEMGERPLPGHGFGSSPASVAMVLGVGLLFAGLVTASRAPGRFWVEADGERVRLTGVPQRARDAGFARGFERLSYFTRSVLTEDG